MQEDRKKSHEWGDAPNRTEGDRSKGAAPVQGDANAAQIGAQLVVEVKAAFEAFP